MAHGHIYYAASKHRLTYSSLFGNLTSFVLTCLCRTSVSRASHGPDLVSERGLISRLLPIGGLFQELVLVFAPRVKVVIIGRIQSNGSPAVSNFSRRTHTVTAERRVNIS